jgi:prepilin-type N-terminal cleavage/methylation domain-containing protein
MRNPVFRTQNSMFSRSSLLGGEGRFSNSQLSTLSPQPPSSHSAFRIPHSAFNGGENGPQLSHPQPSTLNPQPTTGSAFTLIELLVVIAIIAILAALVMPITHTVSKMKIRSRTQGELAQLVTAIQGYKDKRGFYPPDHPGMPSTNQLFYELSGTKFDGNQTFTTLDGGSQITTNLLGSTFNISGILNATAPGSGDEGVTAQKFLRELKPAQIGEVNGVKFVAASVGWPDGATAPVSGTTLNPWCYNSSNPTNNTGSFDLWVDVLISGKTNRICNWSDKVLTP